MSKEGTDNPSSHQPLTGISVRRATTALDVKHTTETTARPATCISWKILQNLTTIKLFYFAQKGSANMFYKL
jgi:hypothetical protein